MDETIISAPQLRDLSWLTTEQLLVVDSLINARAEAARHLAEVVTRMRHAGLANDFGAFRSARVECLEAVKRCNACTLAVDVALRAFRGSSAA